MIFVIKGQIISIGSKFKNYENNYCCLILKFDFLGIGAGWENGKKFTFAFKNVS